MKLITLIIPLIISTSLFSQRFEYAGINENEKFNHEYRFWFDNLEDSNSYELIKSDTLNQSRIRITGNSGEPNSEPFLRLKNLSTEWDTSLYLIPESGILFFKLSEGNYKLESANNLMWDPFLLEFSITKNEQINLDLTLGLAPQFDGYFIYSKRLLKEEEIHEIIECVKKSGNEEFNEKCRQSYYRVLLMM